MRRGAAHSGVPRIVRDRLTTMLQCGALCLVMAAGTAIVAPGPASTAAGRAQVEFSADAANGAYIAVQRSQEGRLWTAAAFDIDSLIELHRAAVGSFAAQAAANACRPGRELTPYPHTPTYPQALQKSPPSFRITA